MTVWKIVPDWRLPKDFLLKYNSDKIMKINVKHVANLANLSLREDEVKKYENQLLSILDYIDKLKEVNTENVQETSQTTGLENVSKKDVPSSSLSQEEALSNAKSKHNGFFKVKAIFENET